MLVNHLKSNCIADQFRLTPDEIELEKKAMATRRAQQADAVTAILRRQWLSRRIVVLGDMNEDPTSPPLQAVAAAGLIEQIGKATTLPRTRPAGNFRPDSWDPPMRSICMTAGLPSRSSRWASTTAPA